MRKLKYKTILNYSPYQLWNAVLLRSDKYRLDCGRVLILQEGEDDHYSFYASVRCSPRLAVRALLELDAIDLTEEAYRKISERYNFDLCFVHSRGARYAFDYR